MSHQQLPRTTILAHLSNSDQTARCLLGITSETDHQPMDPNKQIGGNYDKFVGTAQQHHEVGVPVAYAVGNVSFNNVY